MENLFTTNDVAKRYNVAQVTVLTWIRRGNMEAMCIGGNYRISESAIMNFERKSAESMKPAALPAWKTDYFAYQAEEQAAYDALAKDTAFHAKCQAYHPKLDIPLSLARGHEEYWSTEAAWEKKRAMPSRSINWRLTYQKNIDKSPVYKETPKADYWWKPSGKPPTPPESGEGEDE